MAYYEGKHKILDDAGRENKLVCNHARDIADTASSYFIGNPVSYKSESDITDLTDALELAGADETDGDNGLELSIYGLAYEYIYAKENEDYLWQMDYRRFHDIDFAAQVSVKRTGGGVNGAIDFEVTMMVQSDITYTDPA